MPIRNDAHRDEFHRDQQWHKPCRVATTANVTIATALNAGDSIDGVTLAAGDRVLVKDQSTGSQNGIYVAGVTPERAYDMLVGIQALGAVVRVLAGSTQSQTWWECTNTSLPTIGSTSLTWAEVGLGGSSDAILRYDGAAEWYFDHGGAAVGATETIDLADGNAHSIILDVNCTLTFTGAVATIGAQDVASSFTLLVIQDGTGGNTITWPGSVVWPGGVAPTLDTTGNAEEVLTFWTPDGGTTWYGFHGGSGTGSAIEVLDEGVSLTSTLASLDFVGPGIEATAVGDDVTVTVDIENAGHWEVIVSGTAPPVAVSNPADDDWLYGWVPG